MTKIVTDQVQRSSGNAATFTLPTTDGSAGASLTTDGKGNLSFGGGTPDVTNGAVMTLGGTKYTVPSIFFESATTYVRPTLVTGQQQYTTAGTYSWVAPDGVYAVSVVAVGGGGGGYDGWANPAGSGGGLGWKNSIKVTPGTAYTVVVGAAGLSYPDNSPTSVMVGGNSYFISTSTVCGYGGGNANGYTSSGPNSNNYGGGYVGDGGGAGGNASNYQGGGGAGGYTARGYNARETWNAALSPGGGGGGGGYYSSTYGSGGGGGVGLTGITAYPSPGNPFYNPFQGYTNSSGEGSGGTGAHGGSNGYYGENPFSGSGQSSSNIAGGNYGGGGGGPGTSWPSASGSGGVGGVRIIWGPGRSYPSSAT